MPKYKYEKFEDLPVWQEAARLYNAVLDLLETPTQTLSPGLRNQLDRASLSVSNNIAAGFERLSTTEMLSLLGTARSCAAEVRSMLAVVEPRPKIKPMTADLTRIRTLAESCAKQLGGWMYAIEGSTGQGRRPSAPEPRDKPQGAAKSDMPGAGPVGQKAF